MSRTVGVIGTLDTKGEEVDFLRAEIEKTGCRTLLIDPGILGKPAIPADVTREEVARAVGQELKEVLAAGKDGAVAVMTQGLAAIVQELFEDGRIDAVIAIGGGRGTGMATFAMQKLPVGVPKLMVSTFATGKHRCGTMTGTSDMTLMHSVADILGLNSISKRVLANAAAAVAGMARSCDPLRAPTLPVIGGSMIGTTTPAVMLARQRLQDLGYEFIAFHPTGSGGRAMEEMIAAGFFRGILDLSPHELASELCDGLCDGGPDRLRNAARFGIPQVVGPGGTDYLAQGALDTVRPEYLTRQYLIHGRLTTLVRTSAEEMVEIGRRMAERLNGAKAPVVVMIPLRGFSEVNREGRPLWNPESNDALVSTLRDLIRPPVHLRLLDLHMNDPEFAMSAATTLHQLICSK